MSPFKPLSRLSFFTGRLLSADDLEREQTYWLDRHRRLNRFVVGCGVVEGLRVSLQKSNSIAVSPGFAIDCAGNEIILEHAVELQITAKDRKQFVVISYCERSIDPLPSTNGSPEFSRIIESSRIALASTDPMANHDGTSGTSGCGESHALTLATVSQVRSKWHVNARRRRRAAHK